MITIYQFHVSAFGPYSVDVLFANLVNQEVKSTPAFRTSTTTVPYLDGEWDNFGTERAPWKSYSITLSGDFLCRCGQRTEQAAFDLHHTLGQVGWLYGFIPRAGCCCGNSPCSCADDDRCDLWFRAPARFTSMGRGYDWTSFDDGRDVYHADNLKFELIQPWRQVDWHDAWGAYPRRLSATVPLGTCNPELAAMLNACYCCNCTDDVGPTCFPPPCQVDLCGCNQADNLWTYLACYYPHGYEAPVAYWSSREYTRYFQGQSLMFQPEPAIGWPALSPQVWWAFRNARSGSVGLRIQRQSGLGSLVTTEFVYQQALERHQVLRVGCCGLPAELWDYDGAWTNEPTKRRVDLDMSSAAPWELGAGVSHVSIIGNVDMAYHVSWRVP